MPQPLQSQTTMLRTPKNLQDLAIVARDDVIHGDIGDVKDLFCDGEAVASRAV